MDKLKRKSTRIALIAISFVVVMGITTILFLALNNQWNVFQIFLSVGVMIVIIGSIGLYTTFGAGTKSPSQYLDSASPDVAKINAEYAFQKRSAFPTISTIILVIGVIFVIIGLIGIL
ncbi:MAG: hypothetical protein GF308_19780 [Candidatus Heimdallarchaeota archaeon]|nr:hypothetical protein [Candidatus Heimdallarchaeota archaeon]